jgi:hypothetical protein
VSGTWDSGALEKKVSDYSAAEIVTRAQLTKTRAVLPTQQFFGHVVKYEKYPGLVDRRVSLSGREESS